MTKKKQWPNRYNKGYTHEALHTNYVLLETFSEHVFQSRCAEKYPDVAELAEQVLDKMSELYQLIGNKPR